eukprot:849613-Pelagomonas_calceolata.AAC.1
MRKHWLKDGGIDDNKAEAFWQEACHLGANLQYPEFVKLARLVLSPQRNSLKEQHLTACAQAFMSKEFEIATFPYPEAIGKWLDASKCGRHGLDR